MLYDEALDLVETYISTSKNIREKDIKNINIDVENETCIITFTDDEISFCINSVCNNKEACKNCIFINECDQGVK